MPLSLISFIYNRHSQRAQIKIPLPPLSEQKRIVEILDRADKLRKQRAEADALSERILPALFIKMFGDPATNPMGWEVSSLGQIIIDGPQNGLYKHTSYYGKGTPILRIDSFYDGIVNMLKPLRRLTINDDEIKLYQLRENDIVINRVNSMEYLGKSALIPRFQEPTVFESNMMRFSINQNKVDPLYLIKHLQTPDIKQQIIQKAKHAINQSSLNQQDIKSFKILLPPKQLQEKFSLFVKEIESIFQNQKYSNKNIELIFQSLLYRAFSGDLTAQWREAHMTELLQEMEHQAKVLNLQSTLFKN